MRLPWGLGLFLFNPKQTQLNLFFLTAFRRVFKAFLSQNHVRGRGKLPAWLARPGPAWEPPENLQIFKELLA
jgi:hypothetical protein